MRREKFVDIQAAIEAVDRAIEDEDRLEKLGRLTVLIYPKNYPPITLAASGAARELLMASSASFLRVFSAIFTTSSIDPPRHYPPAGYPIPGTRGCA